MKKTLCTRALLLAGAAGLAAYAAPAMAQDSAADAAADDVAAEEEGTIYVTARDAGTVSVTSCCSRG